MLTFVPSSLSGAQRISASSQVLFFVGDAAGGAKRLLRVDSRVELRAPARRQLGRHILRQRTPRPFSEHLFDGGARKADEIIRAFPGRGSPRPAPHEAGSCACLAA